jgi:hypothetical protein
VAVGGLGVGAGGNLTGVSAALLGVGAGGNVTGLSVAGVGVGSGGTLAGVSIGGIAVGAPRVVGVAIGGAAVGGEEVTGLVVAPGLFRINDGGRFTGVSASAFNYVKGEQHGLTIGIYNFARELFGVQLGLLNYAKNNPVPFKFLPLINVHLR